MKRNPRTWIKVKKAAYARDNGLCVVCGKVATDCHHIVFRSQCGKDEVTNVVCLCRKHHEAAHGENAKQYRDQFLNYIKTKG